MWIGPLLFFLLSHFLFLFAHLLLLPQVLVQVKPVYSPPQLFPIGQERITYTATDRAGNRANCSFTVAVVGEKGPTHTDVRVIGQRS